MSHANENEKLIDAVEESLDSEFQNGMQETELNEEEVSFSVKKISPSKKPRGVLAE